MIPARWFLIAKATFALQHIKQDISKSYYIIILLDEETLENVNGLLESSHREENMSNESYT